LDIFHPVWSGGLGEAVLLVDGIHIAEFVVHCNMEFCIAPFFGAGLTKPGVFGAETQRFLDLWATPLY
jgi:hypothetical protein